MIAQDVVDRINFVLNDEFGYSYTNVYPVITSIVNKILKEFQIAKKVGYLKLTPYSQDYFIYNRYTDTTNSFLPYNCQLPNTLLGVKECYLVSNNSLIPLSYSEMLFSIDFSSNVYFWNGGANKISIFPLKKNTNFEAIYDTTSNDLRIPTSAVSNPTVPIVFVSFIVNGSNCYFYKTLVYTQIEDNYFVKPQVIQENLNASTSGRIYYYLPDIQYSYIEAVNIKNENDFIDLEEDFIDYIVYSVLSIVFERMRLYDDSVFFKNKADIERSRLINKIYYKSSNPYKSDGSVSFKILDL